MSTWEDARRQILVRLARVRGCIQLRDEGGILELINQQDKFCEKAGERRSKTGDPERQNERLCHFCEGLIQSGGCIGMLAELDHASLAHDWERAGKITDQYIHSVQSLDLQGLDGRS